MRREDRSHQVKTALLAILLASAIFGPLRPSPASARANTAAGSQRPIWVVAEGEAQGSDYDPPVEVRGRAENDAKRKAVEEAVGSFLRSYTLVNNGMLEEDLIYARVRGRIVRTKILSWERDKRDPNLYRVKLKALVRPMLPEEEGLAIKLALSRDALKEGDQIQIYYQVNADSYVYIFSIAADNSVTLLFPNALLKDNLVKANVGQIFPPKGCSIHLEAMCLPEMKNRLSHEKVKIIATRRREILLEKGFQEGIFQVYDAGSTALVGDLARKLNQIDAADWGEALKTYTIEPAKQQ